MIKHLSDPELKRLIKGIYLNGERDITIDSSITTIFACGVLDAKDNMVKNTMDSLVKELWVKTQVGGLARYKNDNFRRVSIDTAGNPWFISTIRLARWQIAVASSLDDLARSMELLKWATKNALPSGVLAEQLDPYSGNPVSAAPLLWSHAEFVIAAGECVSKHQEITANNPT